MEARPGYIWSIDPILFEIGSYSVRWYGLFFATAFLVGYSIITYIYKREDKDIEIIDTGFLYLFCGILIGARLGHVFFYEAEYYLANPLEIPMFWKGGLASHGATIGILLSMYLFSRKYPDQPYMWVVSRVAVLVPVCGAFIRIGNFFNSELVGRVADVPWAVTFARVDMLPRHPVQLYESLAYLITFGITFFFYHRTDAKRNWNLMLGICLGCIFFARFILEFFKTRQADFMADTTLSMGQVLSIPFVLLALYLISTYFRPSAKKQ